MRKFLFISCLLIVFTNTWGQSNRATVLQDRINQLENNLSGRVIIDGKPYNILDRMNYYHVKGLSMAVIENYQVVWAKGYGWANEKDKIRVTPATLFKPGSISKSLNAVGVLKLAADHRLDIYRDINEYLTSWKFPYDSLSKGKKISTANLLSHTAGLSVYGGFPGYDIKSRIPSVQQVLDGEAPANTPPVRSLFEPGIQFQYSGGGIIISQLLITDLTHQSYEKFMYDSMLKPLRMTHSYYSAAPPAGNKLKSIAMGYTTEGEQVDATFHVYPEQAPLGLWTNPTELGQFVIATQLANKGKPGKLIGQQMAKLMLTPYIDNSATMGAFIGDRNGESYFFHDAGNEGYRGLYYGSVDGGNGVVVFVNSDDGNIILEILSSVASVYNWKGFDKPANIKTVQVPASITDQYPGVYLYEGKLAEISKDKVGLVYWADGQTSRMYFTSPTDFVNIEFPTEKSFIRDGEGNVTGYARKLYGKELPAATKVVQIDTIKTNGGILEVFGWHLLETKRFSDAIPYLNRSLTLEPENFAAMADLAHCYLFLSEYEKAIGLYQSFIAKGSTDQAAQKNIIKESFEYFGKKGFDKVLMVKAAAVLKL